jgi:hypothetical protein
LNLIPTTSGYVEKNGMDTGRRGPGEEGKKPLSKRQSKEEQASILLQSAENIPL